MATHRIVHLVIARPAAVPQPVAGSDSSALDLGNPGALRAMVVHLEPIAGEARSPSGRSGPAAVGPPKGFARDVVSEAGPNPQTTDANDATAKTVAPREASAGWGPKQVTALVGQVLRVAARNTGVLAHALIASRPALPAADGTKDCVRRVASPIPRWLGPTKSAASLFADQSIRSMSLLEPR